MGPAQALRRLTANHDGATGREQHWMTVLFPICSILGSWSRKVFSSVWDLMGNLGYPTFSGFEAVLRKK
jgi:hypothetical protein